MINLKSEILAKKYYKRCGENGYNQVATPISISNYNIEHKAEFEIFSNRLCDSCMTLSQGINSFFEQGGVSC
jgi:hypothetical protein